MLASELPPALQSNLALLAQSTGRSETDHIREAVERYLKDAENLAATQRQIVMQEHFVEFEDKKNSISDQPHTEAYLLAKKHLEEWDEKYPILPAGTADALVRAVRDEEC